MSLTVSDLSTLRAGSFGTILADPPWQYANGGTRGAAVSHYATMSAADLEDLPVRDLAAEDAHLHLWTTTSFLPEAMRLIAAWGFDYRSMYVWAKPGRFGMGNYWRVSHELLLFGKRGSAPFRCRSLRSWGEHRRGRHSAKPEAIRDLVERASPGPYLELFGRRAVHGWTVWGNQVERDLFTASIASA